MRADGTEIIVRGVVRRGDGLLVVRERGSGWFFLPGGHVEGGEPVRDALVREFGEELGVVGVVGRFLGVVEHAYESGGSPRHELNLVFEVAVPDGDVASREDHLEVRWLDADELRTADVRPAALRELLGGDVREAYWRGC
jgi:8-oxo-dGTP pyrophosphatase MutT (NUDIX family)